MDDLSKGEAIQQSEIDTLIAYFMSKISVEMRDQLDYSPKSLDVVEGWLQERYSGEHCSLFYDEHDGEDDGEEVKPGLILDSHLIRGAAFYIGEVHHKLIGGIWRIYQEKPNPKWDYNNLPVIEGSDWADVVCPCIWIADAICRPYSSPVALQQNLNAHLRSVKGRNKKKQ